MIIILLFSSPNTIWYLFAVLTVMFNSVCKSFSLSAMRSTSSIHRRHPILVLPPGIFIPMLGRAIKGTYNMEFCNHVSRDITFVYHVSLEIRNGQSRVT